MGRYDLVDVCIIATGHWAVTVGKSANINCT